MNTFLLTVALVLFILASLVALLGLVHPKVNLWALFIASGLACWVGEILHFTTSH